MANNSYLKYSKDKRIFLVQPLTHDTCNFFALKILKEHHESFYNQANVTPFECIGNSFFCSSFRDSEHISNTLNIFSDIELSFLIFDVTDNLHTSETSKVVFSKTVNSSKGLMSLLQNFSKDILIIEDKKGLELSEDERINRKIKKLNLLLEKSLKDERFEIAAIIRDELIKIRK